MSAVFLVLAIYLLLDEDEKKRNETQAERKTIWNEIIKIKIFGRH